MMPRYAKRVDLTQRDMVDELRGFGYDVQIVGRPVDLKVRHPSWIQNVWIEAEAKTPNRVNGKFKARADQLAQIQYVQKYGVPYWCNVTQALEYLNRMSMFLAASGKR